MKDRRQKFVELCEKRVNRLLRDIRLVGNLSNRSHYEFTGEDIGAVFSAIEHEVRRARKRFESPGSENGAVFKLARNEISEKA